MPKQSGEGRMEPTAASSVADADGGGPGACPRPLPTAVMDAIEPFARRVRLMGRGFYTDVVIRDREVRTDASDENRGLAVVVLDGLTRFAWINESELARLLKIKENTLILLLEFLEKEKFLKRYLTKGKQVKTNDAIAEKEDGSFNVLAGSYCCLDYSQVETPLPNSCARLDGAESVSDYTGVKVLPNWIVQKGMALTKAEKGEQQPSKDERRVGMKAKRGDGRSGGDSYNVVESGASLRRRT